MLRSHHMWTLAQDGKLYLAPIPSDVKVGEYSMNGTFRVLINEFREFLTLVVVQV